MIGALIFDLDGTLLDTIEDLGNAMNRVLSKKGFPVHTVDAYRYFIGKGSLALVRNALPEREKSNTALLKECHLLYLEDYALHWKIKTHPYPGIPELLDALEKLPVKKAVFSNKPQQSTMNCVQGILSQWKFDLVLGQRNAVPKKPDATGAIEIMEFFRLTPDRFLLVGDPGIDMETARNAGMQSVGVLWGFRPREELESAGADHIIENPLDLVQLIN